MRIEEVRLARKEADERRKTKEEMLQKKLKEQTKLWVIIAQIQKDEGMKPSNRPTLIDPITDFDIALVANTIKAETECNEA